MNRDLVKVGRVDADDIDIDVGILRRCQKARQQQDSDES